ncbi:hypothetical protein LX32DRAFT_659045 [Colletotrichum zoysiae]|uniref:Alphavirus-like MT domain-containing protein n=1 Tax=Colletotrichum zoysiae TaxID=1216348 RepID=A0AAD9LSV1_9PEZI|nr:hypothetical protein LX32DRAFT_659045 [Colletotrichum zoysiae]
MVTKRTRPITERSRELNREAQKRCRDKKRQRTTWEEHRMPRNPTLDALSTEQPTGLLPTVEGYPAEPAQFYVMQDVSFGNLPPADNTTVGDGLGAAEARTGGFFYGAMVPHSSISWDTQDTYSSLPSGYRYNQHINDYYHPIGVFDSTGTNGVDLLHSAVSFQPVALSLSNPAPYDSSSTTLLTPQPKKDYKQKNLELSMGAYTSAPDNKWHNGSPGASRAKGSDAALSW